MTFSWQLPFSLCTLLVLLLLGAVVVVIFSFRYENYMMISCNTMCVCVYALRLQCILYNNINGAKIEKEASRAV